MSNKKTSCYTLAPAHIELVEWYAEQADRSKSAVVDAILKEALAARESQGHFHARLLERLGNARLNETGTDDQ